MPDTPSITIVKQFAYRGLAEKWSNKYHFSGSTPSSDAEWKTLADAIIAAERPLVTQGTSFVTAYGYVAGDENAASIIDYTVAPNTPAVGSEAGSAGNRPPGDTATWVRWNTGTRNSRGKYIYLRKYFHDSIMSEQTPDTPAVSWKNAAGVYGAKMMSGTLPGGVKICGPQGDDVTAFKVSDFYTTRTLKRRGKRPSR